MSRLADEVQSIFDDLNSEVSDAMELALIYRGKERYEKGKKDRVDNFLEAQDRKRSQCEYVKAREAVDPEYKAGRRDLSRELARETTARREDESVRDWYNAGLPLPGLVLGRDIPVPKRRKYRFNVDLTTLRERHAAKRHDSMPILEVFSAQV